MGQVIRFQSLVGVGFQVSGVSKQMTANRCQIECFIFYFLPSGFCRSTSDT